MQACADRHSADNNWETTTNLLWWVLCLVGLHLSITLIETAMGYIKIAGMLWYWRDVATRLAGIPPV